MSKGELTKEEREELATLKGSEFNRLASRHEANPEALSAEERAKLDTYKAQDQAARQAEFKAAVEDMYRLTDKMVKKADMTPEEVARYEGYMNDPELKTLRPQMEIDLRHADAERAAAEGLAKDAAIAHEKAVAAERQRAASEAEKQANEKDDSVRYCTVPGMVATNPVDALRALMADPVTTKEVAQRIEKREAKLRQAQESKNLSDHQIHRLRQGLDDLDRLTTAIKRSYHSDDSGIGTTGVAMVIPPLLGRVAGVV